MIVSMVRKRASGLIEILARTLRDCGREVEVEDLRVHLPRVLKTPPTSPRTPAPPMKPPDEAFSSAAAATRPAPSASRTGRRRPVPRAARRPARPAALAPRPKPGPRRPGQPVRRTRSPAPRRRPRTRHHRRHPATPRRRWKALRRRACLLPGAAHGVCGSAAAPGLRRGRKPGVPPDSPLVWDACGPADHSCWAPRPRSPRRRRGLCRWGSMGTTVVIGPRPRAGGGS